MKNYQVNSLIVEFIFWFVASCITLIILGCPDIFYGVLTSLLFAFVITVLNQILKAVLEHIQRH